MISFILGTAYLISVLLGLARDRLLASQFGAGDELDVYFAAFRIPDFLAMVMILGAISAAIIPVFSGYLVRSKEESWEFISNLLNIFLTVLVAVSVILVIFTPALISIIAPGFSAAKKEMAVLLTRIMFLSPILLGTSNVISAILQVFHRFLATAVAPIMYNLGIVLGILFLVPRFGIAGLAWGVVLGGIMHLLVQIPPLLASGFKYQRIFNIKHAGVARVIKLMLPRSLGLASSQINLIVITALASTLISGSVAIFNLANDLSSAILTFLAVSIANAVFPSLALAFSSKAADEFKKKFSVVFRQILFLTVPVSILFIILRAQIVRLVLGAGQFSWLDTRLTAACLGIFSFSLFAQGLIFLLSKTFYAAHNTKIPAVISLVAVALNIGFSFFFVWLLAFPNFLSLSLKFILKLQDIGNIAVVGLPLAFSLSSIIQFALLCFLRKRNLNVFGGRNYFVLFSRYWFHLYRLLPYLISSGK